MLLHMHGQMDSVLSGMGKVLRNVEAVLQHHSLSLQLEQFWRYSQSTGQRGSNLIDVRVRIGVDALLLRILHDLVDRQSSR